MQAIFDALNFNVWTFLSQVINLLIVFGVLYLIIYRPVLKMVEEREERIEGSIRRADEARDESERLRRDYEQKMEQSRQEALDIVERARKLAEETQQNAEKSAREEADRILTRARAEIEGEKAKALAEIRGEITTLAVLAAGKVIDQVLKPEDHERLVEEFISEVGNLQ